MRITPAFISSQMMPKVEGFTAVHSRSLSVMLRRRAPSILLR